MKAAAVHALLLSLCSQAFAGEWEPSVSASQASAKQVPAAEAEQTAVLKEPVKFGLVVNGKRIGETKVAAGTKVQVVKRDGPRALVRHGNAEEQWLDQAKLNGIERSDPQADFDEGKTLLKGEDIGDNWTRGVELMRQAAEAGLPAAQREWGIILCDGFCVKLDGKNGQAWLRKAAEAGDGPAMIEIGKFAASPAEMQRWFDKAADGGCAAALVMKADNIAAGVAGTGDKSELKDLLARAYEGGDGFDMAMVANRYALYAGDPAMQAELGMTAEEMRSKAVQGFRASIEDGLCWEAYSGLAKMTREGLGIPKDEAASDALLAKFRRLCEQKIRRGSISARFLLIVGLQGSPAELPKDESLRLLGEVFEQSPDARVAACFFAADVLHSAGRATKKPDDIREAIAWLEKIPAGPASEAARRIEQLRETLAELEKK